MGTYKTCVSYIIQKESMNIHQFEMVELRLHKYSFYLDKGSQQVVKWAETKQQSLNANEKIIIINFSTFQM